jgi:O-methyltransferase involved in polyketide biosynthesis
MAMRPNRVDVDRPNAARMYDYFLGGTLNTAVDRAAAEEALRMFPPTASGARTNRSFLRRAVRHLVREGIEQFLDLGPGLPSRDSVHETAQRANPAARVVYVDVEPFTVAHIRAVLDGNPRAAVVQADLRAPEAVLAHPVLRSTLDLSRPVVVLMTGVLHFVDDDEDPAGIVAAYRDAVAPGSYLVISHGSLEGMAEADLVMADRARAVWERTASPLRLRSRAEIAAFFDGLDLVPPGLVQMREWRPSSPADVHDESLCGFGGVGLRR